MSVEITIFHEISIVIFASITFVTAFYFQVARKLESKFEEISKEKIWLVEAELIKALLKTSAICVKKITELVLKEMGSEKLSSAISDYTAEFGLHTLLNLGTQPSVDEANFTKDIVEQIQLSEETKDQLFDLTFLSYNLKNSIPDKIKEKNNTFLKGIISGVLFGMLIPFFGFILEINLDQFSFISSIFAGLLILTLYFYAVNGIYGIIKINKLETNIKNLQKETAFEQMIDTILEIVQN